MDSPKYRQHDAVFFDVECFKLAEHFLADLPGGFHAEDQHDLAEQLQEVCESYCNELEERSQCEKEP